MDLICSRIDFQLGETVSIAGPTDSGKTTFARHLIEDAELAGARVIIATLSDEYTDYPERHRTLGAALDAIDEDEHASVLLVVDGAHLTASEVELRRLRTLSVERLDTAVVVIAQRAPYKNEWLDVEDHQVMTGVQILEASEAFERAWTGRTATPRHCAAHRHRTSWGEMIGNIALP